MGIEHRAFGCTRREVPVIGQGTWNMEHDDRRQAIAALRLGIDLGLTHIDTAEMYGGGAVEELVAEAITGRRDEVFLVSKVLPQNASRKGTIAACERSLARLRTDRLDCYLLHWRGSHPLEETLAAFADLEREGKILSWGVSNFDTADLDQARRIAGGATACDQVLYHLRERAIEHAVIPWSERHSVAVVGYSPFGSGRFPSASSRGGKVLGEVARAHGATAPQVALAFLARRRSVFVIPKASRAEHVAENAAAGELRLRGDEIALVDDAFPLGPRPGALPIL